MAPNSWKSDPLQKKTAFSGGKTKKKLPKFFFWLRDTYKKYILQKNWVKTAIQALSSGQNNLQVPIWGYHRQLDDQHRSPNTNNKDHLVGQLTRELPQITWDNEMFFSFAFCTFFKIFHVRLGKKSKSVSFSRVYVCVKAKLTLVSFFYFFFFAPSPKLLN